MKLISYGKQYIDKDDLSSVKKSLLSDTITQGNFLKKFESNLSKFYGSKYCACVNSGTSALFLAIKSLNLKKKTKIITSPITFFASASAILFNDHIPDFVDIDKDYFTLDINKLEHKLKKDKSIRAVIAVDYAGQPSDWEKINYLKKKYKIYLINDHCHALGSKLNNSIKYSTKYADIVTQSYHPVKHFTTGEGGSVLTNNLSLINKVKLYRNHGMVKNSKMFLNEGSWIYKIKNLGYNFRLSDINCALGISQLKKINKFTLRRRKIAKFYDKCFSNIRGIQIPKTKKNFYHSFHLYPIQIDFDYFGINKKNFFKSMLKKNIKLQVHYIPLHYQPIFHNYNFKRGQFPISEKFYKHEVSLPIYYSLKLKECKYIVKNFKKILKIKG